MNKRKYRIAFCALFLLAAPSVFCSCQSSTAVPAKQPEQPAAVKSLFADAKWTDFRPSNSTLKVSLPCEQSASPCEPRQMDARVLPPVLDGAQKRELYLASYRYYETTILIDRYNFSKPRLVDFAAVASGLPKLYKNDLMRDVTVDSSEDVGGTFCMTGHAQMALARGGANPSYAGQKVYNYRAGIKSNGAETLLVVVFFRAESSSATAAADAEENVKKIISSISGS